MKSFHLLLLTWLFLLSCNAQEKSGIQEKKESTTSVTKKVKEAAPIKGDPLPAYLMLQPQNVPMFQFDSGVRSMFEDSKGKFWYGTDKDGLYLFDGMALQHFTIEDDLPDNQIRNIYEDQKGHIWIDTGTGICHYDGTKFSIMARKKDYKDGNGGVWKKTKGDLWFDAGHSNGVYRYDGKNLSHLTFPITQTDSLTSKQLVGYSVYSIYEDKDNNIWFGTLNKGVIKYDGADFEYINKLNLDAPVRHIFQDDDGNMWFGNNGGGAFKYDGKTLASLTEEKGLTNYPFLNGNGTDQPGTLARIWAIEQDNDGNIWLGTIDAGVWKYDGKKLKNYNQKDGLRSNAIETIYKDKKGKLWFGTKGAVYRFNGRSFDRFFPVDNC